MHPLAPPTSSYVRAAVILGANIMQPIPGCPKQCRLTMVTQVDPGGLTPPVIINHVSDLRTFLLIIAILIIFWGCCR